MKKIQLILFFSLCVFIFLNSQDKKNIFLENEFNKYFQTSKPFITIKEIQELLSIKDKSQFLNVTYDILLSKSFPISSDGDEISFYLSKIELYLETSRQININKYFAIRTLINRQKNYKIVHKQYQGQNQYYYDLLKSNINNVEENTVLEFIDSLPSEKLFILSYYKTLISSNYKDKIDWNSVYDLYININKRNYKRLILKSTGILNEVKDGLIEEIEYYYKILDFKDKILSSSK